MKTKNYLQSEEGKTNAERFLSALIERRMFAVIKNVPHSGMSRTISFHEFKTGETGGFILQFNYFISQFGYKEDRNREGVKVSGCGMDMVFATLYHVCGVLKNEGFDVPVDYSLLCSVTIL